MTRAETIRLRAIVEQAAASLDDKTASTAPALLRQLRQDGKLVSAGTRINWGGTVKRAAVDPWDTIENTPDAAPHAVGGHRLQRRHPRHPGDHHGRNSLCAGRAWMVAR